jgi:formate dehydrogenase beta subunit
MIVQHLHHLQGRYGYLPKDELRRLAQRLEVPMHRVQEVASTFPHFRFDPPPDVEVLVCRDLACHLRGSKALIDDLGRRCGKNVEVRGVSCLGRCDRAPAARIQGASYLGRSAEDLAAIARAAAEGRELPAPDLDAERPRPVDLGMLDPYAADRSLAPYEAVRRFVREFPDHETLLDKHPKLDEVPILRELRASGLLGMGGAGAPASKKWQDVLEARGTEKHIVVNGDESEPATFKDREILLHAPHLVVEGVLLAGLLTNATRGWVYIRHEYEEQIESVRHAIEEAKKIGACGSRIFGSRRSLPVEVFVSPGGYICGEQSALLEAMEDRRAEPRNRPPELATNGLFDKPTLVNNVETFSWTPLIALRGGAAYRDQGRPNCKGRRIFSICGDLERPGVYEVPIGITLGELIDGPAGGMRGGRPLKALAASGPSGGFLPAKLPAPKRWKERLAKKVADMEAAKGDPSEVGLLKAFVTEKLGESATTVDVRELPLDLLFFRNVGLMLGAGMVVYAEGTNVVAEALNALEFFRNESCGKCVPCRLGTERLVQWAGALAAGGEAKARVDRIAEETRALAATMEATSICGLGAVAFNPLKTVFDYFPEDVAALAQKETTT